MDSPDSRTLLKVIDLLKPWMHGACLPDGYCVSKTMYMFSFGILQLPGQHADLLAHRDMRKESACSIAFMQPARFMR